MTTDAFHLQMKDNIMDLEFTSDTDHRKRRRNRTTQSCLNCHTSKRKCDRKRPCQRCIQLGLTGLCVYEIDDPALRDDPTVDETTRLRNRIAELESLVRELRGKPHPRWAEQNTRDADPNEKWHSRASKRNRTGGMPSLLSPIKTESQASDGHLYRFSSPSPPPTHANHYHSFQSDPRPSPTSPYDDGRPYTNGNGHNGYHPSSPMYNGHHRQGPGSSYSDGSGSRYSMNQGGHSPEYRGERHPSDSPQSGYCNCRTNTTIGHAYASLDQNLHSTMSLIRQYHTNPMSQCMLYRRMVELDDIIHASDTHAPNGSTASFDSANNNSTADTEILTPLSAGSGSHASFHTNGSPAVSPHEQWGNMTAAANPGYNPYFPMSNGEQQQHAIYPTHVMT